MDIVKGRSAHPRRIIVYGVAGIGKSTLVASAPSPIFIRAEDGVDDIGVDRFPLVSSFEVLMGQLQQLAQEKHSYKTLALDTLDSVERIIQAEVCKEKGVHNIEDIGYAKGHTFALDYWKQLKTALDWIRTERGMTIVPIAHAAVARFENPETDAYDRYTPRINKHAAALMVEWADEVLFATYKVFTTSADQGFNKKRVRGVGQGERVIKTTERPSHIAKNRLGMPDELPLPKEKGWFTSIQPYIEGAATAAPVTTNGKKKEAANV
jgi:hypothetical protein